jgi:hypothetical protein
MLSPFRGFLPLEVLLILLLLSSAVLGQAAQNDCSRVEKIKAGSQVAVKTKTGQKFEGKVTSVTADSISVSVANASGQPAELGKEEIAETLQVSPETVRRDWRLAKSWLLRRLSEGLGDEA